MKTGSNRGDCAQMRILVAGFVARRDDTRMPKCVMFGELVGGRGVRGGSGKIVDGARRGNKGRNVSWRNRSLQRKSGLDDGMQYSIPERDGKDQG